MRRATLISAVALALLASSLLVGRADASQIVSGKITDLAKANVAFTGTCTAVELSMKEISAKSSVHVTKYTFQVEEVIKGDVGSTFSYLQFGSPRGNAGYMPGIPEFKVGTRYTVFLTSESPWGLRGVISLGAGKFNFVQGPDGKAQVVNDYGNKTLFTGLPNTSKVMKALSTGGVSAGAETGPIDYKSFVDMMKELSTKDEAAKPEAGKEK